MAEYNVEDGTRITLDSATLRELLRMKDALDIKSLLCKEIRRQKKTPLFLTKKFNIPCKEAKTEVLYLCDGEKCEDCSYPLCKHTEDIEHAKNFRHHNLGIKIIHTETESRESVEEEFEEPCRFRDTCIGACDWCESHDYSEACVPMLQAEVRRQTKSATEAASFILKTILNKGE